MSEVFAQPSMATTPSRASIADGDPAGIEPRRLAHEIGIADRRGADDDARHARSRASRATVFRSRMPPPSWSLIVRWPQNAPDRLGVDRLAGERPVEIDDMEIVEPLRRERLRLGGRVGVEHGCARHVAMQRGARTAPFLRSMAGNRITAAT